MKKVYFRVDGNEIIATGHIMRCLSIARQVEVLGGEVCFVLADGRPHELIARYGYSCDILDSQWDDLDQEINQMIAYIRKNQVEVLFLDTYYVTENYLKRLPEYTRIVYLDDLGSFIYPVHAVINYGVWSATMYNQEAYRRAGLDTEFLLGASYIPLRDEFCGIERTIRAEVREIMITTGGTDQLHVTGRLLQAFIQEHRLDGMKLHVIVGSFNRDKQRLQQIAQKHPEIILHENVANMSYWMTRCDIAISASGSTLYELAACGTPTICLEVADNQRGAVWWQEEGYMLYAGNAALDMRLCVENTMKAVEQYRNDYELRCKCSNRMHRLVDGNGARRIAEYLIQ